MKEATSKKISKDVNSLIIEEFDIYNSWADGIILKDIIRTLFIEKGEDIFFQFRMEERHFLAEDELLYFREAIPKYFKNNGKYEVVRSKSVDRFDSFGLLPNNDDTINYILNFWKYFYGCDFFIPRDQLTWEYLMNNYQDFLNDVNAKKILGRGYADFICIKGLGADYLMVNYMSNYSLPDLSNDISSTPSLR